MLRTVVFMLCIWWPLFGLAQVQPDLAAAQKMLEAAREQINVVDLEQLSKVQKNNSLAVEQLVQELGNKNTGLNLDAIAQLEDSEALQRIQQDIAALLEDPEVLMQQAQAGSQLGVNTGPLLLVSFSMPKQDLLALATSAAKSGATLVLRGAVDNNVLTTSKRIQELIADLNPKLVEQLAWVIDPTLFSRFAVNQVPTLVVTEQALQPCSDGACTTPDFAKVAGSASLNYLLTVIEREAANAQVAALAATYRQRMEARP